ncbi:lipoyl(octanoyl) transferase LipB [Psychrobacter sp. HD31]|uniref:lipoyl(octanoyl) transferase LipB n=1 Tax=Psychrobacter sp. HD31 TaxID=3112003 RepID=UPI003DA3F3D8
MCIQKKLITKELVNADYQTTHDAMLSQTLARIEAKKQDNQQTDDELWIVDHNDVFTLGQAGKEEHILARGNTPIIKTDRGGQVTWHGHGQLVVYFLLDLNALGWKVRDLVSHAEQAIEDVVNQYLPKDLMAKARQDAPGVYIFQKNQDNQAIALEERMLGKIASLGFKIKQGFSYHGIALNLSCDLAAFNLINPCGYAGMQMLRLADFATINNQQIADELVANIAKRHAGEIVLR